MASVIFGNHSAIVVARAEQEKIRRFFRDVLGCELVRGTDQKDDYRMGDDFYIAIVYENGGVALDASDFLKATYLELKTDHVEDMKQRIIRFGVNVLDIEDRHLYFQAPGGQVFRLVGTNEDLSEYEGTGDHRQLPSVFT